MTINEKLFLIIPTLKQGGAERVMSELANKFVSYGVDVHLVLLTKSEDFYELDERVNIHRLYFNKNKLVLTKPIVYVAESYKLIRLLFKHKPKTALSFMTKYNILSILCCRVCNVKIYVSDRSNPNKELSKSLQLMRKFLYPLATGVIAQTEMAKNKIYCSTRHKNITIIPNPVKEIKNYHSTPREPIILNIGRLIPEKGQSYLIQAFHELNLENWKLVILGDGPLYNLLRKQIADLDIEDKVYMPGSVKDIDQWLAKSSIFVLSSVSEGFPNALLEAMSSGLPCISFDCDAGPSDIIENNVNGILIPMYDIEQLKNSILSLILSPIYSNQLASEALKTRDKYNLDIIANKYLELLLK